jgi:Na+/melibiose symporter-like transporter
MISVCFIGFAQGALFPVLTMKTLNTVKLHQTDKAIAVSTAFIFSGQFLSPLVLDSICKLANQTAIRFQFGVLSVGVLISAVIVFFFVKDRPSTLLHEQTEKKSD